MTEQTKAEANTYLEFAKANDRDGANAYIEKHFGALGTEEHDEKGLADFTKEVLDLVEKEALEAAATTTAETTTSAEENTTDEVQATDTDSESTN